MKIKIKIMFLLAGVTLGMYDLVAQISKDVTDSTTVSKVNVAYGKQQVKSLTGSVEVINSDVLESNSFTNTQHAIIGKFAGMVTQQNGGEPGNNNCSFVIRGQRTTGSSSPLVLIDGYEGGFAQISTIEIESITILKDAVATAMYGMRGANGVILVTTKRGFEGKTVFNTSLETGLFKPVTMPDFVDAATYATLTNEALANDGLLPRYSENDIAGYLAGNDPYTYPNVDWTSEMMKSSAPYYNARLEFKGGDEKMKFFVGSNYLLSRGLIAHTNNDNENRFGRFNIRSNVDIKVNNNTDFSAGVSARMEERTDPQVGVSALFSNITQSPANRYVLLNEDGSYGGTDRFRDHPLAQIEGKGYSKGHIRRFTSDVKVNHRLDYLLDGLYIGGDISIRNHLEAVENWSASSSVFEKSIRKAEDGVSDEIYYIEHGTTKPLQYSGRNKLQESEITFRTFMGYDQVYGDQRVSVQALYQQDEIIQQSTSEPFRYQSIAGRFKYSLKERYFAELTAAWNGTNAYNPGKQFGFFPAAGLAWLLSEEDFLKESSVVDYAKIRGSFGLLGNDRLNGYRRFMYLSNYQSAGNYYLTAGTKLNNFSSLEVFDLPNEEASWEKAYQANFGLDLKLFKLLDLSVDLFSERRTDILQSLDNAVTNMVGVSLPRLNYGEVESRGIEIVTGIQKNYASGFSFSTNLFVGYRTNEILKRYENDMPAYSQIGHPVSQQYGLTAIGFYQDAADIASSPVNTYSQVEPGDVKYKDINGPSGIPDGVIDDYDISAIGYGGVPEINFGVSVKAGYKGFYVSADVDGVARTTMMLNNHIVYRPLEGGYDNISTFAANNYWTIDRAQTATLPRLTASTNFNNYRSSTLYQKDGSFISLRTAELGYTIPSHWLQSIGLEGTRIYLRGHNLLVFHGLEVNPEVPSGHPQLQSFTAGVNVKF
jgi:TonB-linked SusC/RagA family outer membrane protein